MLFFTYTELYLQPASQYTARKKFDLAEIITHCPMSPTHFTRHFGPRVTLRASARHPDTPEQLGINPDWKTLMKPSQPYRASAPLRFSPPACQNAFNNWILTVSTESFIDLIINVDTLYWRLPKQHNLFSIATPKKNPKRWAITKFSALPTEVSFNLMACKFLWSLLHNLFL